MINFDEHIFSMGWVNHQLDYIVCLLQWIFASNQTREPDNHPTQLLLPAVRQLESAFALFLPVLRQVAAKAKVVQERFFQVKLF